MRDDTTVEILLVEDNPGDVRYIEEHLPDASVLTEHAAGRPHDGQSLAHSVSRETRTQPTLHHESRLSTGLEALAERTPDVVILDLNLPDSDGLDTVETMRKRDDTVPIVVLTGLRDRHTGIEALRRGADEFLVKDEINPGLLLRTLAHAIERKDHERELQRYETIIEESTDVNVIVDADGTFRYLTPSVERVLGYDADELVGENAVEYVHADDRPLLREELDALAADPDYRPTIEFRFEHADGSWVTLQVRGRNLLDDPMIEGVVLYTADITPRKEYERTLKRQREQLAALNQLNDIVHEITTAVLDQSTREEIEATVCERLADTESYLFAWIGEVDTSDQMVSVREKVDTDGYTDEVAISVDPDDERSDGPTGTAVRTRETQTVQNVFEDPAYEPWRKRAREYGFQSSAAIPIVYEDTLYGVLNVYSARPHAFTDEERAVISQLGEIVGHAITAVERKRALTSDELVELEFRIRDVFETIDVSEAGDEQIEIEQAVPIGDGDYLVYGTTSRDGLATVESIIEQVPYWNRLEKRGEEFGTVRFEVELSDPPVLSAVADSGGTLQSAVFEDGDYLMTIRLPQGTDIRAVIETVQEAYPNAEALARRQITNADETTQRIRQAWLEKLTERQRTSLEVAYYAGFFEWPRESSGEEVAETLDISPATFSQHIRAAQNKLFGTLLEALAGAE